VERWVNGGEMRTGVFTVPTGERIWGVDFWVRGVERVVQGWIDAAFVGIGFAMGMVCPQFAQGG
jgi:hypothetical protein